MGARDIAPPPLVLRLRCRLCSRIAGNVARIAARRFLFSWTLLKSFLLPTSPPPHLPTIPPTRPNLEVIVFSVVESNTTRRDRKWCHQLVRTFFLFLFISSKIFLNHKRIPNPCLRWHSLPHLFHDIDTRRSRRICCILGYDVTHTSCRKIINDAEIEQVAAYDIDQSNLIHSCWAQNWCGYITIFTGSFSCLFLCLLDFLLFKYWQVVAVSSSFQFNSIYDGSSSKYG